MQKALQLRQWSAAACSVCGDGAGSFLTSNIHSWLVRHRQRGSTKHSQPALHLHAIGKAATLTQGLAHGQGALVPSVIAGVAVVDVPHERAAHRRIRFAPGGGHAVALIYPATRRRVIAVGSPTCPVAVASTLQRGTIHPSEVVISAGGACAHTTHLRSGACHTKHVCPRQAVEGVSCAGIMQPAATAQVRCGQWWAVVGRLAAPRCGKHPLPMAQQGSCSPGVLERPIQYLHSSSMG